MKKQSKSHILKLSDKAAQNIFYMMPRVSTVLLFTPIAIVQGVYAKYYGLSLTTIASVILFVRLFDAITDPIIGYFSDKSRSKRGTRKPYMVLGAIVFIISGYFFYSPPDDVSALYFACWITVFYLGFTLFEIPHLTWGGEISHGTHEKTQTYMLRTVATYSGVTLFYSIPLLPLWETTEITPSTLKFSAIVAGLLMLPSLYLCMKRVPNGSCYSQEKSSVDKRGKPTKARFREFSETVKNVTDNKPLLLFFCAFLFAGSAQGMWLGLIFTYVDAYLGMGFLLAKIALIAVVVSIPGAFVWLELTKYLGKKNTWLLAMLLAVVTFAYTSFLEPGNAGYWPLLILLTINNLYFICLESIAPSMLSDIVDYSTWKFRTYRGATYFALYLFAYKGAGAVGVALGLAIAGWHGFDPTSTSQTESGIRGLKLAMTWVPTLLAVISVVFIALSPITARRHGVIRRRLDTIEARSKMKNGKNLALDKGVTETLTLLTTH